MSITLSESAWVSVLNPICHKMSSIKWTIFLFKMKIVLTTVDCSFDTVTGTTRIGLNLEHWHMTSVNGTWITYRSTLASSHSSSDFSQVGCQIGISKYWLSKILSCRVWPGMPPRPIVRRECQLVNHTQFMSGIEWTSVCVMWPCLVLGQLNILILWNKNI